MLKRIRFATRAAGVDRETFTREWCAAAEGLAAVPSAVRPVRVAVGPAIVGPGDPEPRHDAVAMAWFPDADALARFDAWCATPEGAAALAPLAVDADPDASPVVDVEESVGRGAEWLEERWRSPRACFKHMAVARRADGLSPAEFADRWRNRAGSVRTAGAATATEIPAEARGLAYVQDHPLPAGEWAYDAVNEVWFDDLAALRVRADWFAATLGAGTEDDLVREHAFLVVREQPVPVGG